MKIIKIIVMMAMLVLLSVSVSAVAITNCTDFENIANDLSGDYTLSNSFSCSANANFTQIGNGTVPFDGTLNGNGYTVSDVFQNTTVANAAGIFGGLNNTGFDQFYNINFDNITIHGGSRTGLIVGGLTTANEAAYYNDITVINSVIYTSGGNTGFFSPQNYGIYVNQVTINDSSIIQSVSTQDRGAFFSGQLLGDGSFTNIELNNVNHTGYDDENGIIVGRQRYGDVNYTNITINNAFMDVDARNGLIAGRLLTSGSTTITNVTITDSLLDASGQYAGGFIGDSPGGIPVTIIDSSVDLNITTANSLAGGFIGNIAAPTTVTDSTFIGIITSTTEKAGCLAGSQSNTLTVTNFTSSCDITGTQKLAGVVGYSSSTLTVINSTLVSEIIATGAFLGGVAGEVTSTTTITGTTFTGTINTTDSQIGGLIGKVQSGTTTITQSKANAIINSSANAGGLIGLVGAAAITINQSIGNVTMTGSSLNSGAGIIGAASAATALTITDSYAMGTISGYANLGGIVGYFSGTAGAFEIINTYTTIDITGTNYQLGGMVGNVGTSSGSLAINDSFVLNGVSSALGGEGGIVSYESAAQTTMTNVYWQSNTTTATNCIEATVINNTGCTARDLTSSYYDKTNAPLSSWDFANVTYNGIWVEQISDTPCLSSEDSCSSPYVPPTYNHSTPTTSELSQIGIQTITQTSYTTVLTSTIEVPVNATLDFTATGDVEGSGSNSIANCQIVFDSVQVGQKTTTPANNQHKSFSIQSDLINKSVGNYTVSFECKKDGSSRFDVEGVELIITEYIDQNNVDINVGSDSNSANISSSSYQLLGTTSFALSEILAANNSIKDVVYKMSTLINFDSTGTICYILEIDNTFNSSEHCRYGAASDSGTGSYFHITENVTTGNETVKLFAKSTTSDGSIDWDNIHFEMFGHETETSETDFSIVSINSSTYQDLASTNIIITDHTEVAIVTYAGFSVISNSGAADMSFRLVLENNENGTVINRDVLSANQNGLVSLADEFENLSTGNYTIILQGQSDNSDATITGGELISFTTNEVIISPIGYYVYALSSVNNASLSGFNATTSSDNTTYSSEDSVIFIPLSVATDNVSVVLDGFTLNLTLNHNTTNDLTVTLVPVAPTLLLTLSPSDSEFQPTQTTATGTGCSAGLTCTLYRNGVNVVNPEIKTLTAGVYVYVYNTSGNANNSPASVTDTLTITAPNPVCYPVPDSLVPYNTTYTWNAECNQINGLENLTVTCDDGYSLNSSNLNLTGSNYSMTDTSNYITESTTCTITANSFTGEQSIYTQILTPTQDGQLIVGMCLSGAASLSILWMVLSVALILLIIGYITRIGIIAFVGAISMMAFSWYIVGCVAVLGISLMLLSVYLIFYSLMVLPTGGNQ